MTDGIIDTSIVTFADKIESNYSESTGFMNKSLIFHFRPKTIKSKTLDFTLTFGLGGMALVLVTLLFGTGLLLKFYYLPFPDRAYDSILYLDKNVMFGLFIRNIHYWSANILVIVTFLHFLRVFFTSAFHPPRQLNWIIGIGLFLIILVFNFTGYLLPWDQLSFWAVTICTSMMEYIPWIGRWMQTMTRGGAEVGPSTLSIFYAAHTALLPALIIILAPFHFWRIRKAGGVVVPEGDMKNDLKVPAIPDLILRELVTALVLTAFIFILSILFNAPLGDPANPGLSPNPTKAPWYFMSFQETLLHIDPFFAVCVIPVIIAIGLIFTAYSKYPSNSGGIWFISTRGRTLSIVSFTGTLLFCAVAIIVDEYFIDFALLLPGIPQWISNGLIPATIVFMVFSAFYMVIGKLFSPDKNEKVQVVFVFFITVLISFTITGVWFRGEGMALIWPF